MMTLNEFSLFVNARQSNAIDHSKSSVEKSIKHPQNESINRILLFQI